MNNAHPQSQPADRPEVRRWTRAADIWIPESEAISAMTSGATRALLGALDPQPGERFVDLCSGPGEPALAVARAVGDTGRVLATDAVPGMLAELMRRASAEGLTWVETRCAPAEDLELPLASFDGASCRFGAMFFDDPTQVLARLLPALVPGGRAAFLVWGPADANPYFTVAAAALDAAGVPAPAAEPGVHGVFAHAEPGALAAHMRAAGWEALDEQRVPFDMHLPGIAAEQYLTDQAERSPVLAGRLATASAEQVATATSLAADAVRPYADEHGVRLPALALLVSGRRPG